jgi:hypothetical protein
MQAKLEKVPQKKFNFFHKIKIRPHLTNVDIAGALLIAASIMFGFSFRADQRSPENKVVAQQEAPMLSGLKNDYGQIMSSIHEIEFDKNPEKMKKEIWEKFAVSAHFAYVTKDSAELGFTYKGENFTANINKDKDKSYLYVPAYKYMFTLKDGHTYLLTDQ